MPVGERPPVPRLPHLPALDGMRALAVASVFAYHADVAWARGGFLGVDVFFVISGFLITALLLAEWREYRWLDIVGFWKRRALRLLPALFLLLVAVWVLVPLLAPEQGGRLRGDVRAALAYVSNWRLIFENQSYFEATGRPPLLQHLWSLAVEEQFYLVWPPVLWAGLALRRRARKLFWPILALAGASAALMAALSEPGTDPSRVYYGTDTRAGALLLGAALACVWDPARLTPRPHPAGRALLGGAGVAALAGLAWCLTSLHQFSDVLYRGGFLGVAALATVLVAVAAHPATPGVNRVLGAGPLVWLGRRSYGIYLAYWPVLMLTRAHHDVPVHGNALLALRAGVTVALAALSYRFVEQPVRDGALGRLWADLRRREVFPGRPRRAVLAARTGTAAVALAAITAAAVVARPAPAPTGLLASAPASTEILAAAAAPAPAASSGPAAATSGPSAATPGPSPATAGGSMTAPTAVATGATTGATTATTTATTTTVIPGATTAPATPAPAAGATAAVPGEAKVTGLGDSVLLEAKAELERRLPHVEVDAVVARQFRELLAVATGHRDSGRLGTKVVLQLGNNGPVTAAQFDEIMAVLAGAERVVVINVKVPRAWEAPNNEMIAAGVKRWPNAVLMDWHGHGAAHPELFADDGTHMAPRGAQTFVELVLTHL